MMVIGFGHISDGFDLFKGASKCVGGYNGVILKPRAHSPAAQLRLSSNALHPLHVFIF